MIKRKSIFTKVITIFLIALLSSSALTGCKKSEQKTNNTSVSNEASKLPFDKKITFRVWGEFPSSAAAVMKGFGDSEMYKELEKRTNVHLDFMHPVDGQVKEQFNLMIASKDLPDFIIADFGNYQGGRIKAFEDGVIIDVKEPVAKYAPDLTKLYTTYPDILMDIETEGGNQLYIPSIRGHERLNTYNGGFLRKDWLDELGLKLPETIDEWYVALKAFKDKKGAESPFTGNTGNIKGFYFTGAWGIDQGHFVENGKVLYGAIDPRYKEYAKTMAKWYKEGLIDSEIATNINKNIDAKLTSDKSGASLGNAGGNIGKYIPLMKDKNPKYSLVGAPYPTLKKGDFNPFMHVDGPINPGGSLEITTACKNVKEAVSYLNYGYTKEGMMLYNFGIEGVSYKMENGYPKYTDLVVKNPNGQPSSVMGNLYTKAFYNGPFVQDVRYHEQYMVIPEQQQSITNWTKYSKQVTEANKKYRGNLTPDENSQIATKQNEINTYKDEMFLKWLMGREDIDATWDKYVEQIKKLGIEDINKIRQTAYDRYVKKFPQALKPQSYNASDIYGK